MSPDDHQAAAPSDLPEGAMARLMCKSGLARQIRENARLTLAELAGPAGISPQAISRYETGQRSPRGAHAVRYYRALVWAQELTANANEAASA